MDDTQETNATGSVPRLVLAIRRLVWALGIVPVMLLVTAVGFGGMIVGFLWMGLMWISGSRHNHDAPVIIAMGAVELIWNKWNQLSEDPVRQNNEVTQ